MKINYLVRHLLITLLIVNAFAVSAQNLRGGFILGANAAQIDGDNYGGYNKLGLNTGVRAELPFSNLPLLLSMDLLFSQKGAASAFLNGQASAGVVNVYSVNLNYLEVPVTLDYVYKNEFGGGIGLSAGKLVGSSEVFYGLPVEIVPPFQPWDINIIVDGLYLFGSGHWRVNVRYMYSMRYVNKNYGNNSIGFGPSHFYNYGEFNNVLAFRLIYMLGNPPQK